MNIFYVPVIQTDSITLSEEESGHAIRALRLRKNDPVTVADGKGLWCSGSIKEPDPKKCVISIQKVHKNFGKRDYFLHLAVAPTKNNERFDWLIEKATEIGLDEFTPLSCQFSERKTIHKERLTRVAIAAMKQSQKAYLPDIHEIVSFDRFIAFPFDGDKYIAHCHSGEKPHLQNLITPGNKILVLIGPEGDFSAGETDKARECHFREVSLGESRLRTETAAMIACVIASLANQ